MDQPRPNEDELNEFLPAFLIRKARETAHSREQKQSRKITPLMGEIIQAFGKSVPGKGDAQYLELPREFIKEVQKASQCRLIIVSGSEVTCEWKKTRTQMRMKSENRPMSSRPDKH